VDLQRELARVLGEIDSMKPAIAAAQAKAAKAPAAATTTAVKRESNVCPHCGAKFPLALKFCGECGKALAS
jgi:membrane protease subunit (stomatin/prohibitin family)